MDGLKGLATLKSLDLTGCDALKNVRGLKGLGMDFEQQVELLCRTLNSLEAQATIQKKIGCDVPSFRIDHR